MAGSLQDLLRLAFHVSRNKLALLSYPPRIPLSVYSAAALSVVISSWVAMDVARDSIINNEIFSTDIKCQRSTFDYIVVGAGTAGIIVATRLANASKDAHILLLEAGGERSVTWGGKMLGGSSSTNFMLYARGHKEDFNRWAIDAQDEQWNYENVLPYFKKSENYNGAYASDPSSRKYHGQAGLLHVGTHDYMPGVEDFLAAGVEKGYSIGDYNGENQEVFSKMDVTTRNGWRESTYRAFYKRTGRPANLCIKKYAHVSKILFEFINDKTKAVGVEYQRQLQKRSVRAVREVILSAGTMGSCKLLLLSGVGPADQLALYGIPLVKDLPVGQNVQDHTYTLVGPFLKGPSLSPTSALNSESASTFIRYGNGPLAAPGGFAGTAFFQSPQAQPPYPDLQAIQFSISLFPGFPTELNKMLGLDIKKLSDWLDPYHRNVIDARFLFLFLGRPKSTGQITLANTDPNEYPVFDPRFLSHPDDIEAMLFGFKKLVDLYENSTSLNTPLFPNPVPACANKLFKSDDYYRCVIRQMSGSFSHAVGSCALGKVVDHKLRVKGIDGLRVVDASIMPRTPNANTQAASIMIGEKGADLIIAATTEE